MSDIAAPHNGELMDRVYRYQRHIYDFTRKYYLLGRDQLIASLSPPARGHVLEVGCGTGRNLIAAARAYPRARFYGLDISAEMLETARANIERAGLGGRITLARADAADFEPILLFGRAAFDRVFFSYSLSMVPPWRQALECAALALAPGGRLHVVDFGQQERLPHLFRTGLFLWLKSFHVSPRPDLFQALCDIAEAEGGAVRTAPLYRGYAWYGELRAL
ncbi:S-adenosylmethionine-diacylgycerolhomoserine-N-methyltransferase [Breoghania corrubedonensis]|uniref:S-adenosylmethionine-diacylgycerolhomoserine-N-methyltransferase n=1 Tax=Breoghania corrubedonensis TaxID=665038 RepID=A0A2T5V1D4_9HYPH|nr:class I SAM-dependent methyltransferase [Breoghania corrubedonensis]PTW57546.1 S-adenosylmethionine-diacylgycerolhomoserine-N-methyltransferase [Breoghania corrubedonensis]